MKPSLYTAPDHAHTPERAQLGGDVAPVGEGTSGAGAGEGRLRVVVLAGVGVVVVAMVGLYLRAAARTNHVALSSSRQARLRREGQGVDVPAGAHVRRHDRRVERRARRSAVRLGLRRHRARATRRGRQARRGAGDARLSQRLGGVARDRGARAGARGAADRAIQHEAERTKEMQQGGFASANEVEQLTAKSAAEKAEVGEPARLARVAQPRGRRLHPARAVRRRGRRALRRSGRLRAARQSGRDGHRSQSRCASSPTRPSPTSRSWRRARRSRSKSKRLAPSCRPSISRRAPAADDATRTVHFEIDVPNADHVLPVGTTARLTIDVGEPQPATAVPLRARHRARRQGDALHASQGDVAKSEVVPVLGESGGTLVRRSEAEARARRSSSRGARCSTTATGRSEGVDAVTALALRNPDRGADGVHRPGGLRGRGHAAHERRHLPRADAAGAGRRHAGARPRPEGRREDHHLAPREVRQRHARRRSRRDRRRATACRSSSCGSSGAPTSTRRRRWCSSRRAFAMAAIPKSLGVLPPFVLQYDPSNAPVVQVVVSGGGLSGPQLFDYAFNSIEPLLEGIPGVASASLNGGRQRQINIVVDPVRGGGAPPHLRRTSRRRSRSRTRSCRRASSSRRSSTPTSTPTPCRPR